MGYFSIYIRWAIGVVALSMVTGCVDQAAQSSRAEWKVSCSGDPVTNQRRCFAGTFGSPMNTEGQPYLSPSIPFQVYYEGRRGPFVLVGFHDFPGERPSVRFDGDSSPLTVPDDAGVSARRPAPGVVDRMLSASVARARFFEWPNGQRDMYVDLSGFGAAWAELQSLVK